MSGRWLPVNQPANISVILGIFIKLIDLSKKLEIFSGETVLSLKRILKGVAMANIQSVSTYEKASHLEQCIDGVIYELVPTHPKV